MDGDEWRIDGDAGPGDGEFVLVGDVASQAETDQGRAAAELALAVARLLDEG